MVKPIFKPKILETDSLIPAEWREAGDSPWVFNPGMIARSDGQYIICYRVANGEADINQDASTHEGWRRLACAVLDRDFNIVPGSVVAFSDFIKFPENSKYSLRTRTRHEDPRLFRLNDGLYITFGDGSEGQEPNHQFRLKLNPLTLRPFGHAQEFVIKGHRNHDEKNWMPLDVGGFKIIYSTSPFRILKLAKEEDDALVFRTSSRRFWDSIFYEDKFGELRGGATPVKRGNYFYMFGHSSKYYASEKKRYYVNVVKFTPDGHIVAVSKEPLSLHNPLGPVGPIGKLSNLTTTEVVFPGGAIWDEKAKEWILSYGINDEACAIVRIPHVAVEALLTPVQHYGPIKNFATIVATSQFGIVTKQFAVAAKRLAARAPNIPRRVKRKVAKLSKFTPTSC